MNLKYLMCGAFACMLSSGVALSASLGGGGLDLYTGCCTVDQKKCNKDSDCTSDGYLHGTCGTCTGAGVVDPVEPVDPACIDPKVPDSSGKCVCPQLAKGTLAVVPSCDNGHFDDTICTCSCDAGYYQKGDACIKCPDNGTSKAGATKITDCYVTTFKDDTGSGVYTSECYYTE